MNPRAMVQFGWYLLLAAIVAAFFGWVPWYAPLIVLVWSFANSYLMGVMVRKQMKKESQSLSESSQEDKIEPRG
ncbi:MULTISPECIES: hypothetical protein [Gammaproteobacteria]|uniref:hypothetical protein n=1 Tax=Gammaproteobacteria TaxID=1236 RepID=UPI001890C698|nr:hypothetical protein [Alloalcanivorax venustensis]